jgi:hypothetical protein
MRFYVNLDTGVVQSRPDFNASLSAWHKRGTDTELEMQFVRSDGTPELLPVGTAIIYGVKPPDEFDTDYLADATVWTRPADATGFYTATLTADDAAIDALLKKNTDPADDVTLVENCNGEVAWQRPGAARYEKSRIFSATIENDVNRAGDLLTGPGGVPVSTVWNYDFITGLTGGGSTNLDGLATASGALPVAHLAALDLGNGLECWRLIAGTNAEDAAAGYVRPDDYDGTTNAKVWHRVSLPLVGSSQLYLVAVGATTNDAGPLGWANAYNLFPVAQGGAGSVYDWYLIYSGSETGELDLNGLGATSAPNCPPGVTTYGISDNALTAMPVVPKGCVAINASNNSLTLAAEKALLLNLIANGDNGGTLDISGGENIGLDSEALGYVATLTGRGWTITHY